jgi:hypothetical protein
VRKLWRTGLPCGRRRKTWTKFRKPIPGKAQIEYWPDRHRSSGQGNLSRGSSVAAICAQDRRRKKSILEFGLDRGKGCERLSSIAARRKKNAIFFEKLTIDSRRLSPGSFCKIRLSKDLEVKYVQQST